MLNFYKIHRYQNDTFQYVVPTTNKHTEEEVRQDVGRFNAILNNEMKSQGIRYVFSTGSIPKITNKRTIQAKFK